MCLNNELGIRIQVEEGLLTVVYPLVISEELKKFLHAVAVNCRYMLPSSLCLPSHYFIY